MSDLLEINDYIKENEYDIAIDLLEQYIEKIDDYGCDIKNDNIDYDALFDILYKFNNNDRADTLLGYLYIKVGEISKGKKILSYLSKNGCMNAIMRLADLYYDGFYFEKNYDKCIKYLEMGMEKNNNEAIKFLAYIYQNIKNNHKKALKLYQKAGDIDSMLNVAEIFYFDLKEKNKAKTLLKELIKTNNSNALYLLGIIYSDEKKHQKARVLYEKTIPFGHPDAIIQLALMYENGIGVDINIDEAKTLYEMLPNDIDAMNSLANLYENENEFKKAINIYKKCMELGDENAFKKIEMIKKKIEI